MDLAIDHRRRPAGAKPETEDRLQCPFAVGGRAAPIDLQPGFDMGGQRIGADRLARLGATQFQHMAAGGPIEFQVVIEARDPIGLGLGDVERLGQQLQCGARNMAENLLKFLQRGQQSARHLGESRNDPRGRARLKRDMRRNHAQL